MQLEEAVARVAARIKAIPPMDRRHLIALAGPPASGKSTLAEEVAARLPDARVVPMDGFHLDNRLLQARNLQDRKGAPETFDVNGFRHVLTRLHTEDEVVYPLFDRSRDCAIAGAGQIGPETRIVLVEGNYLLLDAPGWKELRPMWDFAVYLSVPPKELRARLMQRWFSYGFSEAEATRKVEVNDLPNARTTAENLLSPDMVLQEDF